jgi:hypothetical protein
MTPANIASLKSDFIIAMTISIAKRAIIISILNLLSTLFF